MTPLLSIRNLRTHIFDEEPPVKAVDGVDLDIGPGEILALVGESGCGKTMLALSIGRLLPPAAQVVSGSIRFEETELTQLAEAQLRSFLGKAIAYLFQDPFTALNPVLSVEEQLCEAIELHCQGTPAGKLSLELLVRVQIPEPEQRLRQYPHQLSGGMRQRVLLAIALAGTPRLLIADEPTTALDVTTQAEILRLLKDLCRQFGTAILLITHDLAGVATFSDRIAVMYAGRIVETVPTSEFYKNASHPYSQALLACIPKGGEGKGQFHSIPGSVPDLRHPPSGCPFHPRCPEAFDRCPIEEPKLKLINPNHHVSCWKREC